MRVRDSYRCGTLMTTTKAASRTMIVTKAINIARRRRMSNRSVKLRGLKLPIAWPLGSAKSERRGRRGPHVRSCKRNWQFDRISTRFRFAAGKSEDDEDGECHEATKARGKHKQILVNLCALVPLRFVSMQADQAEPCQLVRVE